MGQVERRQLGLGLVCPFVVKQGLVNVVLYFTEFPWLLFQKI